jgi:hypothetical protein
MLVRYLPYTYKGYLLLTLLLFLCTAYAYYVNARRAVDDPQKRNFHLGAVFVIPTLWPLLLLASLVVVIIRALVYSIFLGLTLIAIMVFRKPFILVWLDKIATKIGNQLLEVNNYLIRLMFGKLADVPQST